LDKIIGFFIFLSVLFAFWGFRSIKAYEMHKLRSSLDGNFTVEEEQKEKKPFQIPFLNSLYVDFKKAGFRIGIIEFTLLVAVIVVMGYAIVSFLLSSTFGFVGMGISLLAFRLWIRGRMKKRTLLLRGQFANALVRMANMVKVQVPLEESIRLVAEKVADPLKSELDRIYQYFLAERNIIKALKMVEEQMPLEEFHLFVISAEINQEVGGNLAELMEKLALTIGDKQEMDKKLQAYSVQGKNSATTIALLPVFAFVFFRLVAPAFIAPMTSSTLGQIILLICFSSILFGWWYVRKLVDVTLD
jgi:tight adherence protein B